MCVCVCVCVCVCMCVCDTDIRTHILVIDYHGNLVSHLQFPGEWEVAMVQIINQTGSAKPLQVSCVPKFLGSTRSFTAS